LPVSLRSSHAATRSTEGVIAILMLQRLMAGPNDTKISDDFLTLAYQAIDE